MGEWTHNKINDIVWDKITEPLVIDEKIIKLSEKIINYVDTQDVRSTGELINAVKLTLYSLYYGLENMKIKDMVNKAQKGME